MGRIERDGTRTEESPMGGDRGRGQCMTQEKGSKSQPWVF